MQRVAGLLQPAYSNSPAIWLEYYACQDHSCHEQKCPRILPKITGKEVHKPNESSEYHGQYQCPDHGNSEREGIVLVGKCTSPMFDAFCEAFSQNT
jgi:hypothetical protein